MAKTTAKDVQESLKKVAPPVEEAKMTAKESIKELKRLLKDTKTLVKDFRKWFFIDVTDADTPKGEKEFEKASALQDEIGDELGEIMAKIGK